MSILKFFFAVWLSAMMFSSMLQPSQEVLGKKPAEEIKPYTVKLEIYSTTVYCKVYKCPRVEYEGCTMVVKQVSMTEEIPHRSMLTDDIIRKHGRDLLAHWPALSSKDFETSIKYWKGLYKQHGESKKMQFSPEQYLTWGMEELKTYGPKCALALFGYGPLPGEEHSLHPKKSETPTKIGDAIHNSTGYIPDIVCILHQHRHYLLEIHFCFNEGLSIVDCYEGKPKYCPEVDEVSVD